MKKKGLLLVLVIIVFGVLILWRRDANNEKQQSAKVLKKEIKKLEQKLESIDSKYSGLEGEMEKLSISAEESVYIDDIDSLRQIVEKDMNTCMEERDQVSKKLDDLNDELNRIKR